MCTFYDSHYRTSHLTESDVKKTGPWTNLLAKFLPSEAFSVLSDQKMSAQERNVARLVRCMTEQRIPYLHLYVITTSPAASGQLPLLFQGVPCRIHVLKADDFFTRYGGPIEHAVYDGVGVDRCANLYGATKGKRKAVLVVDGGTALTWTATNAKGQFQGAGGITPGLGVRCRSIHESTGALPLLDLDFVRDRIEQCESLQQPLSTLACTSTEDALLVGILGEMAHNLSRVIAKWVADVHHEWALEDKEKEEASKEDKEKGIPEENGGVNKETAKGDGEKEKVDTANSTPMEVEKTADREENKKYDSRELEVIVTGGDAPHLIKLLHPKFSHILEPDERHEQTMNKVKVHVIKHLSTYGIGEMLKAKAQPRTKMSGVERMRQDLLGLRIVQPAHKTKPGRKQQQRRRGTIYEMKRNDSVILAKDMFKIKYDNGETQIMDSMELFGRFFRWSSNCPFVLVCFSHSISLLHSLRRCYQAV